MTSQERELAERMGVADPQHAVDMFWARQRGRRSYVAERVFEILKMNGHPFPKQRKKLSLNDAPTGIIPKEFVLGQLGLVGSHPVTYRGQLVMWSFNHGGYVLIPEPTPQSPPPAKRSWWHRLMGLDG